MSFSVEQQRFWHYLKAVGTGIKGNRDLCADEAQDAFTIILNQAIPNELIGAFLTGLRLKPESDAELLGCVKALKAQTDITPQEGVEISYSGDGKKNFAPLMMMASQFLDDINLHVMSNETLAPKYGMRPSDFAKMAPLSDNITIYERKKALSALSNLSSIRNNLNIRTIFNSVEKLNFLADCAIIGMHHGPYFRKYATLFGPHYKRLLIVQGHEGSSDVLKRAKYKLYVNNILEDEGVIIPEDFGINSIEAKEALTHEQIRAIVVKPDANTEKMVRLNAAIIRYVYGDAASINEAFREQ